MINPSLSQPWLPFGLGPVDARARMFCLPFAGGGASNFIGWRDLCPGLGVIPVQYPGHETRIGEAPLESLDRMIDGLAGAIAPLLDRPYLLFGYSMGAKLAFALAKRLVCMGLAAPRCLLVAAHLPPDRKSGAHRAIGLPDPAFKQVLRDFGGMPDDLLDDDEFCAMALPVMRADFALAVQAIDHAPLDCPILAYAGNDDNTASPDEMAGWQRFTSGAFRLRAFAGGHFFLRGASGFDAALRTDLAAALNSHDSSFPVPA